MSTFTLPNIRVSSDLTVRVRLKDGGLAIDWSTLNNIKAHVYSDAQRALAGRCAVSVDTEDPTVLVCEYSANKPQYLGVNRIVVQARYMGETKTYDKPAFNFVRWTDDQEGEEITISDPDVDVEIDVEDVTSSILQNILDACIKATEEAQEVVDVQRGPRGFSAYEVAVQNGFEGTEEEWLASLEGKSAYEIAVELGYEGTEEQWIASLKGEDGNPGTTPHIGQNGNWFIGDVDTGVAAEGQNGVTPHIGGNGNWFIGDTDTGVLAMGTNGVTPHIGNNGHWFIGDTDTNVVAEGQDGNPGITPHIGANNHWFIGETDTGILAEGTDGVTPAISIGTVTTVEPGTPAAASMTGTPEAPVLNLSIPKGVVGDTPNFTVGTVTTGEPGTPVVVTLTGTAAAPVLNIQIPQGMQGNTGSSVDYPYELVNNLTTNDATKGLSAQQGKVLKDELSQLEAEVHNLSGKYYGLFADDSDLPEGDAIGYAFVGTEAPFAIWNFDGEEWADSGATVEGIAGEPGVGFESVESPTPADGTLTITLSNGDEITLDLNHNHPQYTKVVVCEDLAEYQAITTKDSMTFYLIPQDAMYLGDTLILEQGNPLPYTPVEYIQTDGTAYIDTGIKGNSAKSSEIKITPKVSSAFATYLGSRLNNTRFLLVCQWGSAGGYAYDNYIAYGYGTGANPGVSMADSLSNSTPLVARSVLSNGSQKIGIKEQGDSAFTESTGTTSVDSTTGLNIFLFASNQDGSAAQKAPSGARVYYCKIFSDNNYTTLVFDGIPCLYNNEYGLWDRVSNTFFGNAAGSGAFSGPSI